MLFKISSLKLIFLFVLSWCYCIFKYKDNKKIFYTNKFIITFIVCWIAAMLFEYLYLGPLSFVYLDDEAELTLSYLSLWK